MKYQLFALFFFFVINGTASTADDTQTRLKAMEAEANGIFKLKGTRGSYLTENCPKQLAFWLQAADPRRYESKGIIAICASFVGDNLRAILMLKTL